MGKLERSVLDTRGMPLRRAIEAWEESIGVMYDVRLADRTGDGFHSRVEAYRFGALMLGECRTVAQSYDRSRFRLGRDLVDCYAIQVQEKGGWLRRDRDDQAAEGDIIVMDKAQPQSLAMTDSTTLHLFVPRAALSPLLKAPDAHNMRVLSGEAPLPGLLRGHLRDLWRVADRLDADEGAQLAGTTLQLVAAAMNGAVTDESRVGARDALRDAVARHVDRLLLDPGLTADGVAGAFGISRRKLFYLFEPHGGFDAYVRKQRLRRVRAALLDPLQAARPIAEIAEAHGFSQRKNFNDAFRKSYDMTPRQVRDLARQGVASRREVGQADWRGWIAGM